MSVFFVAFAGTLTLTPADGSLFGPCLFLGLSLVFWWGRRKTLFLPPRTLAQLIILNSALGVLAIVFLITEKSLSAWFHISILLQVYIYFSARKAWNYSIVYILALTHALVAALLPTTSFHLLIFLYFLFGAAFSLILHHFLGGMRRRVQRMIKPDPRRDPFEREFRTLAGVNRFFFASLGLCGPLLLAALILFLLLPRNPGPPETKEDPLRQETAKREGINPEIPGMPWDWPRKGDPSLGDLKAGTDFPVHGGFSGTIDIGSWGILFESEREVLRVVTSRGSEIFLPDLPTFYLRGVVLDEFTGTRWTVRNPTLREILDGDDGRADGIVSFADFDLMDARVIRQSITARREFGPIRFHLRNPVGIPGARVFRDENGALWARESGFARDEVEAYNVFSRPLALEGPLLRRIESSTSTPPDPHYISLPPGLERVSALARRIADPSASPWANALMLIEFLNARCRYSKEAYTPPPGISPIEVFLYQRRAGHCEVFATALAVMLRAVGIPSRLVGGFRGGEERSELDASYIAVRESHAHAWVEIWLDVLPGWVLLDPTPPTRETEGEGLPSPSKADEAVDEDLHTFIMRYNQERQRRFLATVFSCVGSLFTALASLVGDVLGLLPLPVLLGLVFCFAAGVGVWLHRRGHQRKAVAVLGKRSAGAPMKSLTFYVELLVALRKLGYIRRPSQTPAEFARGVLTSEPELSAVQFVTDLFHLVRYREVIPPRKDLL
ncbi:MAG: transglutaminase TgpA family protein, partial [Planctomycetota bacterium]